MDSEDVSVLLGSFTSYPFLLVSIFLSIFTGEMLTVVMCMGLLFVMFMGSAVVHNVCGLPAVVMCVWGQHHNVYGAVMCARGLRWRTYWSGVEICPFKL